jgi:hypothetical protein
MVPASDTSREQRIDMEAKRGEEIGVRLGRAVTDRWGAVRASVTATVTAAVLSV